MLYSPGLESDSSENNQSSLRNSILKAEAPESQLVRFCLNEEVKIRNYNSKMNAKHADDLSAKGSDISMDEEFENMPEFN